MPREHWNDIPGDLAGGEAENLPGGFGSYDPDADIDASVDELTDNDVRGPLGEGFGRKDQRGGDTTGTAYAEAVSNGSTVDPAHLLEGEEAHPGAAVGFTGGEIDKTVPPHARKYPRNLPPEASGAGGTPDEARTAQQAENFSTESSFTGGEGAAGDIQPPKGKPKAA